MILAYIRISVFFLNSRNLNPYIKIKSWLINSAPKNFSQ